MDTVPICVGAKPVRKGNVVRSADPKTGLGADDRAGVAVVLNTFRWMKPQPFQSTAAMTWLRSAKFPAQAGIGTWLERKMAWSDGFGKRRWNQRVIKSDQTLFYASLAARKGGPLPLVIP